MGDNLKRVFSGAAGVTHAVVDSAGLVVEGAAGVVATAVANTPMLKNIAKLYVHRFVDCTIKNIVVHVDQHCVFSRSIYSCSGFWEAYEHVREFIHAILRKELVRNPTTVFFTGHSLGGALATFAALDVQTHTVPRVNAWLKHQAK